MKRIVFINRVYWPSTEATAQILRDLTLGLAAKGTSVVVITSTPLTDGDTDDTANLRVLRVGEKSGRSLGVITKLRGYSRFTNSALSAIKTLVSSTDVVVAMTDPPMLGSSIGQTVRTKQAQIWHWTQDLYPEVALAIKPFGPLSALLKFLLPRRNREWINSTGIVAIGSDMAGRIAGSGISSKKIAISPNWAPAKLSFERKVNYREKWGVSDESFLLAYSGNLGRAHILDPLLDLVLLLQSAERVKTVIIGQGPQRATLMLRAEREQIGGLTFQSPVPLSDLGSSLAAADVHLITMRPDCSGSVWPSKFYGVVATGRPVIFIGPKSAEIFEIITKSQLGIAVEPTNLTEAQHFVMKLADSPKIHREYCERVQEFALQQPGLEGAINFWNRIVQDDSPLSLGTQS